MSLLVVGSVAFDAIETPFGRVERTVGGAATYFSLAASFFTRVNLVGVVGEDFGADPESFRKSPYIFLANIDPTLQRSVLEQVHGKPKLVALDTMNYWISGTPEE